MTPLATALQREQLSGTSQQIQDALNEDVALPYNTDLWTYTGVANQFGPVVAEGIAAVMQAAGLTTAVQAYAARGFDLSLDATRAQLDVIAQANPQLATACNDLKAIGRPVEKRFAKAGLGLLPTLSQIADAVVELASNDWANRVRANVIDPMVSQGKTVSEIKTAVAEYD